MLGIQGQPANRSAQNVVSNIQNRGAEGHDQHIKAQRDEGQATRGRPRDPDDTHMTQVTNMTRTSNTTHITHMTLT